ncbi:uncharacterized protein [Narcine bancroftii]|uniref:uncharacterized protein n=1 Tax=Narcine bancroftii TaxID=1343680 RepID=UPI00383103A9
MMFAAKVLQFPQLFLAVSIVFPLLLILVMTICVFCRRFSERVRSHDRQLKVFMENHTHSVKLKNDPDTTNENGMFPRIADHQMVTVIDELQVVQRNQIIQSMKPAVIDADDNLYEDVRDVLVNDSKSNEGSQREQKADYTTQCDKVPSSEPSWKDEFGSTNEQAQTQIYAKVVKLRKKECQLQIEGQHEVGEEEDTEEPPPVPDKHLDDEGPTQM